ncbi:hypothetical protein ETAA8_00910 [Anatilimnocola aggregata]|uniref:DUF1552 domain-containing protein n=1 Tax=Anatilimnocola aggregata TaxID=2528021 RepID=A0A517Y4C8_9BACT|nr:hypothetical protein ETAA8_00910 [Anatilimnocola aggregata]
MTINRRTLLQQFSVGAGGMLLTPFLQKLEAQERGTYRTPKRVVFVLFGNGFPEFGSVPTGVSLEVQETQQIPLDQHELPFDIEPFKPYKDRLAILHGLRGGRVMPYHGGGFGALSGLFNGAGTERFTKVAGESIDAAIARKLPGIFPILNLGIDPGSASTQAHYCSSAWGPGRPIASQCRPELAYQSLFGSIGATKNDFASRRNLLDLMSGDIKKLEANLTGIEREQLDHHIAALEALSKRESNLSNKFEAGTLAESAPQLPSPFPVTWKDTVTAQFDIAASALAVGLTNVVTITSELCAIRGKYSGISDVTTHQLGHDDPDKELNLQGFKVLALTRRHMAERTAALLEKLKSTPEDSGTMLDNTLVVFMSDSAETQHSAANNWPFVLLGNLGGRIRTNQLVLYPMREHRLGDQRPGEVMKGFGGKGLSSNPTINTLYNTLLHAVGDPRPHFNLIGADRENPALAGPLKELLVA